jgi:hypothetical protein
MSHSALSILGFGLYLAAGGLLLLLTPQEVCGSLQLHPPGNSIWVRLSGMFFLDLAFYCIKAALDENKLFIRWSILTRPWTLVFLGAFVAAGFESPRILIFGIVDVLATLWTVFALRVDRVG